MRMKTTQRTIPDLSSPGPRTVPSIGRIHQDGGGNYATGGSNKTICARNKKLATPRTPEIKAVVQTLFKQKKVRRSLLLDCSPKTPPPQRKAKSSNTIL
ncbi:hypothetical protein PoB_002670200 [Plakobranchus ocellatus]|uniref:Uncharacterized protein n=1 Tax=Plakobranchus ocellatus TaxID=259542 RepID=A0AAV3ZZT4_9GAST|nr:hypothetical protein PoB_002670200 [Plakobranchus ocellatus]